jgi:hypothetical protein
MKKSFCSRGVRLLCACVFVFSSLPLLAWNANEVDFPSVGNSWSLTGDSTKYKGPDGSSEWFRYQLVMPTSYANYPFLMVNGNDWDQKYGGNIIFERNSLDVLYYGSSQPDATMGAVTAGKRYIFTVKNPGLADTMMSVQELDNDPISISSVSRNTTTGVITINLSAAPSPQEKVYVRYTDDSWTHWAIAKAVIAGSSATVSIPEVKDGRTYQWYVFTSAANADKFYNGFSVDCNSLAWNNNSGSNYTFNTPNRITDFTVNVASGAYQTTKFFIDEIAGESAMVNASVTFGVGITPNEVEVVTNLNRRHKVDADADGDGVEDGIIAPSRDLVVQNENHYFKAYPMTFSSGAYRADIAATQTGAYRLTVRYRMNPDDPWIYYQGRTSPNYGGNDHSIVVSPKKTLEMTLYEINPLTVEATAADQAGRSNFQDLLGAADGDTDGYDYVSLDYFNLLQVNCLWFQPIHPTGGAGVENDPATSSPYVPGSPYATKNFFAVNPFMGSANTEASALAEFQNFVAKADTHSGSVGTINVMLDFVANHTAWDAIYGQGGVDLGFTATSTDRLPINWYSRKGNYGLPARWHNSPTNSDIAIAPDRTDFGKWNDVAELNYGRYSCLVELQDGSQVNRFKNEEDVFDRTSMSPEVIKLWRYLGYYPEYWLEKTGHSLSNSTSGLAAARLTADDKGIDSLRCDFGQGLPNGLWEYIINRTRAKKWNFVFMAETLDGAEPGYRSNRVFDILNESIVFQFTQTKVNKESDIQIQLENRRNTYRSGSILLNITGHDEILPDNDPWLNATRYGALSTVAGLPMIFNGQEQGIQNYNTSFPDYDGFTHHELNFGKFIPHFKKWNQARWWTNPPPNNSGLAQWYGRVNWARINSPALRGLNQFYLDKRPNGTTPNDNAFAIAKYEIDGGSPAFTDVVLGFANLFTHGASHGIAADTFDIRGGVGDPLWAKLGMMNAASRLYNIRNLASSNAAALLWGTARTGSDIYSNGIFVSMGGGTVNPITADGELVQFLKIVDVTPPPAPLPLASYFAIGTSSTFSWSANGGSDDNITDYLVSVGTTPGGTDVANNIVVPFSANGNSHTFSGVAGQTYYASIKAVSAANVTSTTAGSSDAGLPNPASPSTPIMLLEANGDADGDCITNLDESIAGTNPLLNSSKFTVASIARVAGNVNISFPSVIGRYYRLETSTTLQADSWVFASANLQAVDLNSDLTHVGGAGDPKRFYRVKVSLTPIP